MKKETAAEKYYRTNGKVSKVKKPLTKAKKKEQQKQIDEEIDWELWRIGDIRKAQESFGGDLPKGKKARDIETRKTQRFLKRLDTAIWDKKKGDYYDKSEMQVAHELGITVSDLTNFVWRVSHKSYENFKRSIKTKHAPKYRYEEGVKIEIPNYTWNWQTTFDRVTFAERINVLKLDPIISTETKIGFDRLYPCKESGREWSGEMRIFGDDRNLQPIKRLRIAGHSFLSAEEWKDGTKRHNATCELAKGTADKKITVEGGVIISIKFANRSKKTPFRLGDKILGINGLKGIVCKIRSQEPDIIINKNQIWGDKSSRKCGAGVLEVKKGILNVFWQPDHLVGNRHYPVEENGRFQDLEECVNLYGKECKPHKARFSPDLVPFLVQYLGDDIKKIMPVNIKRFRDIMYMLNADFEVKNKELRLTPFTTAPKEREGGKLMVPGTKTVKKGFKKSNIYIWGDFCASEKEARDRGFNSEYEEPKARLGFVPKNQDKVQKAFCKYYIEKIWIPDWFEKEEHWLEKGKWKTKRRLNALKGKYVKNIDLPEEASKLLFQTMFSTIEESIGHLIAVPKLGAPDEVYLNAEEAKANSIEDGDSVLFYRSPVVSKYNVQKVRVKYSDNPMGTICVNVETIALAYGDNDGDSLYVIKIPQDEKFGEKLVVDPKIYAETAAEYKEKIKKSDNCKLPETTLEIKQESRLAFFKDRTDLPPPLKVKKTVKRTHGWLSEKRYNKLCEDVMKLPEGEIRTDTDLIEEARMMHDALNTAGGRVTKVGSNVKWAWMAIGKDKEKDAEAIEAIASLEVMKDRVDIKNTVGYVKSIKILEDRKISFKTRIDKDEVYHIPAKRTNFHLFLMTKTFAEDFERKDTAAKKRYPNFMKLANGDLCPVHSPYAKFLLILAGR